MVIRHKDWLITEMLTIKRNLVVSTWRIINQVWKCKITDTTSSCIIHRTTTSFQQCSHHHKVGNVDWHKRFVSTTCKQAFCPWNYCTAEAGSTISAESSQHGCPSAQTFCHRCNTMDLLSPQDSVKMQFCVVSLAVMQCTVFTAIWDKIVIIFIITYGDLNQQAWVVSHSATTERYAVVADKVIYSNDRSHNCCWQSAYCFVTNSLKLTNITTKYRNKPEQQTHVRLSSVWCDKFTINTQHAHFSFFFFLGQRTNSCPLASFRIRPAEYSSGIWGSAVSASSKVWSAYWSENCSSGGISFCWFS